MIDKNIILGIIRERIADDLFILSVEQDSQAGRPEIPENNPNQPKPYNPQEDSKRYAPKLI